MKRKFVWLVSILLFNTLQVSFGQSVFTDALGNQDFNDPANWTNGLPDPSQSEDEYDLVIKNGLTASTTASFGGGGEPDIDIIIGQDGTSGTLIVNAGHEVYKGNSAEDIQIGVGAGSVGYVELYGMLDARGNNSYILVGDTAGGVGYVNVYNGGLLNGVKGTYIRNGKVTYYPQVVASAPKDLYEVWDDGTIAFVTDGTEVGTVVAGDTDGYVLSIGADAKVEIILGGAYQIGDSWTLFNGVGSFTGANGTGTGVFSEVVNKQGATFDIVYNPPDGGADGSIVVTLTSILVKPVSPTHNQIRVPISSILNWEPGPTVTPTKYDVYFGTDPNEMLPNYGLNQIVSQQLITSVDPLPGGDLEYATDYAWFVNVYEPNAPDPDVMTVGPLWTFRTEPPEPKIDVHPQPVTVASGSSATFSVATFNAEIFTWYKVGEAVPLQNGGDISGADTNTLQIANVEQPDEGEYYCVVANSTSEVTVQSNPARLLTHRLIAHWSFEDDLMDDISGFEGIYYDPNELNPLPIPTFVQLDEPNTLAGKAFQFEGDGRHIQITDSVDFFNFYPQGYTVNAWVKTTQDGYGCLVSKQELDKSQGFLINHNADNAISTLRTIVDLGIPAGVMDGQWHMITGSYDPLTGIVFLYSDGIQVAMSDPSEVTPETNSQPLIFGAATADGLNSPLLGYLDEVSLWTFSLSPTEVAQMYANMSHTAICYQRPTYDFNNDCVVDLNDFAIISSSWLSTNRVGPQM